MPIEKKLYDQTDWELLRVQKLALVETESALRQAGVPTELLVGLIHFVDAVQDDADTKGYPVYGKEEN
jgi:hypothetical protein